MDDESIRKIVKETIEELKRQGFLRSTNELAYAEISSILAAYYQEGQEDEIIRKAVEALQSDPYYKIIPLYFDYGYTIERIAEAFCVEISTITRNKKRLCLQIYNSIQ